MSIYPERKKDAVGFTGYWLVEVTRAGKKVKERYRSFEDASMAEAYLKGDANVMAKPGEAMTLRRVHKMAEGRLYAGTKDELQSGQRLAKAVLLLGPDKPIESIRLQELERFVDKLLAQGLNPKTVNRYLAAISKLLRWAHKADLIAGMPHIPRQKEAPGRKVYLPENLDGPFLDHILDNAGHEYVLAAEVLLFTGVRVGELLGLAKEDIEGDLIHLHETKTGNPRSIPLPEGYGELLVGLIGRGSTLADRMPYRKLLDAIGEASEAVFGKRLGCHAMRHTTATRLTRRGIPTLTVAEIMGHRNLATTRIYTHHEVEGLRSAMASLAPGQYGGNAGLRGRKPLKSLGSLPPAHICSPLRSHSATRPSPSSETGIDSDLDDSSDTGKPGRTSKVTENSHGRRR